MASINLPLEILKTLIDHEVEFVVVGGIAAVAMGAPVGTWDVDVVYATTPANGIPLAAAREAMPNSRLDAHPAIGNSHTYADLLPHTETIDLAPGLRCRVLETQIAIKEEINSEKDRAMLPILRRTLAEKRRLR